MPGESRRTRLDEHFARQQAIYFLMLLPLGLTERLGTYVACLVLLAVAGYFLLASVVYWVRHPAMQMRGPG